MQICMCVCVYFLIRAMSSDVCHYLFFLNIYLILKHQHPSLQPYLATTGTLMKRENSCDANEEGWAEGFHFIGGWMSKFAMSYAKSENFWVVIDWVIDFSRLLFRQIQQFLFRQIQHSLFHQIRLFQKIYLHVELFLVLFSEP